MIRDLKTPALMAAIGLTAVMGCKDPTADKPKAEVVKPAAQTASAPAPAPPQSQPTAGETLALSQANSSIGFVGSKVTGSHEGEFKAFTGSVSLKPGMLAASTVTIDIDMTSVVSDNERLTGHLKSADFFDVEKFATATFKSTAIEEHAAEGATHMIAGDLTLHGVTQPIRFPATIAVTDSEFQATAEFSINRKDFGIVYAGKADDLIRDDVLLKLHLQLPRAS